MGPGPGPGTSEPLTKGLGWLDFSPDRLGVRVPHADHGIGGHCWHERWAHELCQGEELGLHQLRACLCTDLFNLLLSYQCLRLTDLSGEQVQPGVPQAKLQAQEGYLDHDLFPHYCCIGP